MNIPDLINGSYELLAAPFILLSVYQLYKDKKVRGLNIFHIGFFVSWGFWNLWYYPHLNQWYSFIGGIFVAVVNSIWLVQVIYYIRKENKKEVKHEPTEIHQQDKT